MSLIQIIILAVIQGFAELLPVSSSAHVILAQKLMGLDSSSPEMTFFLVMLHTGTMFAVLVYFFKRWKERIKNRSSLQTFVKGLILATAVTGVFGLGLKLLIEKVILEHFIGVQKGEVESLFSILPLIAFSLVVAGTLIIVAGRRKVSNSAQNFSDKSALIVGFVQGLCLPFRGLSRSGATISTAVLCGTSFRFAEDFSFALAVLLTPPVIFLEVHRLMKANVDQAHLMTLVTPGLVGMVFSFISGLLALKWLSAWLEEGRWSRFGYYCLALAAVTLGIYFFQG